MWSESSLRYLSIFAAVLVLLFLPALWPPDRPLSHSLFPHAPPGRRLSRAWSDRRLPRARSRAGAHRRRERMVALAFWRRSHRPLRRALGTRSKSSRSVGLAPDAESARRFPNRSALFAGTNSGRSGQQDSAGRLVDRARRRLVQRHRGDLVGRVHRAVKFPFESLGELRCQ